MKITVFWLAIMFSLVSVSSAMTPIEFWKSVWANENLVNELRDACQIAKDPTHCFGVWLSISNAESNMCKAKSSHWCFGMVWSSDKSAYRWVKSYNKYRYKATNWFYFYGDRWTLSKSRYCTSEDSSWSKVWCPNGKRHFDTIYNDYYKNVYDTWMEYGEPVETWFPKPECRRVWNVEANEYVQIDSWLWELRQMIFPKQKSKLFICSNPQ